MSAGAFPPAFTLELPTHPRNRPPARSSFDCKARELAWQYGKQLAPQRGSFKSLFDALQLGGCPIPNPPAEDDSWQAPTLAAPAAAEGSRAVIYVDAELGDDGHDGASPAAPLRTLQAAVSASRAIVAAAAGRAPARHIVVKVRALSCKLAGARAPF